MKKTSFALALCATLGLASAAFAQDPPSSAPDAKGNAPVKHRHTVNDGGAKSGANSFTQNEARKHIVHSGYESVSGLTKGKDGVWRGTAMKGGVATNVALDFKGNVSEGAMTGAGVATSKAMTSTSPTTSAAGGAAMADNASASPAPQPRHRNRHAMACNTAPGPKGVACSGVDHNKNGVSDKEDRALKAGAKP